MPTNIAFHNSLYRLAQIGDTLGIRLVRIISLINNNRYTARPIEFAAGGGTQFASEKTMTVTNLAEPADQDGQVPANTDAIALDVEGRWVLYLQVQPLPDESGGGVFPAKIVESLGGPSYSVRQQICTGEGGFADKSSAPLLTACNLAERSLGPGGAVAEGTIVLVTAINDNSSPPTTRYIFDHPVYAKYLD